MGAGDRLYPLNRVASVAGTDLLMLLVVNWYFSANRLRILHP
jgi:hypothetical protein